VREQREERAGMADAKGRPIIRPKEVEEERLRKRREFLMGMRDAPDANDVRWVHCRV
jgi:hypothetical protein